MLFFGPRAACPHCGRNVGKPGDPARFLCPHCHAPGPWASPAQVAQWNDAQAARREYAAALDDPGAGGKAPAPEALAALAARAEYAPDELRGLAWGALDRAIERTLADHELGEPEEAEIAALMRRLAVDWQAYALARPGLGDRLAVARANAGRLTAVASPRLIARDGEVVYGEYPCALVKEVARREYRAGYSGLSLPIGHTRARIHVGGARGHSVVVGTQLVADDTGWLEVSSQRAVFLGAHKTIELDYARLANLTMFADGLQFHVTNRQGAPLFKLPNGELAAAVVNAAAHAVR